MLKLLGAILIISATTSFGFYLARSLYRRTRQIRELQNALQLLETEIVYGATPLSQALQKTGEMTAQPLDGIFRRAAVYLGEYGGLSTYECWKMALEETWPSTFLQAGEKDILLQIGQALGRSDRSDQQRHLRMALQHLLSEGDRAKEEQERYEKMCRSLGFLGGLLLALLMI